MDSASQKVIELYVAVVLILTAGTARYKWRFGVFSDWPDRLLKSEQAQLDLLNQTSSEHHFEKYTRAEILKIKRDWYARVQLWGWMWLLVVGLDLIGWLTRYEPDDASFRSIQMLCWYGFFVIMPFFEMRRKLSALDPTKYRISKTERMASKIFEPLWRTFLILCGCISLCVILAGAWALIEGLLGAVGVPINMRPGDSMVLGLIFIATGTVLLLMTKYLYRKTAERANKYR